MALSTFIFALGILMSPHSVLADGYVYSNTFSSPGILDMLSDTCAHEGFTAGQSLNVSIQTDGTNYASPFTHNANHSTQVSYDCSHPSGDIDIAFQVSSPTAMAVYWPEYAGQTDLWVTWNFSTYQYGVQHIQLVSGVWTEYTAPPTTHCIGTNTNICYFTPLNNSTSTGPTIDFYLQAYINHSDLDGITGIKVTLHNIDQNVLLFGALSPSDKYLFEGEATTSGEFNFSTSTTLGDGNYRLEACLERSYLGGFLENPFANVIMNANDCQSHQFIVGQSTFIGDVSQQGFDILNNLANGTTTATTTAQAGNCYFWLPTTFNIFKCGTFLLVPDGYYLNNSIRSFRDGVLTRIPWGYLNRTYEILSSTTTVALPTYTASVVIGTTGHLSTTSLAFDPGDMLAGGAQLITDTRDPFNGKNARDIFEPIVQLVIALAVVFTIVADITGSHRHHTEPSSNAKQTKT